MLKDKIPFAMPRLVYSDGKNKRMVSWRLPDPLLKELDRLAKERGLTTTEFVNYGLDQLAQWGAKEKKKNP